MLLTPNEQFALASSASSTPRYTSLAKVYGAIPQKSKDCRGAWYKNGRDLASMGRVNPLFGSRQLSHSRVSKTVSLNRKPPLPEGCKRAAVPNPLSYCKTIRPAKKNKAGSTSNMVVTNGPSVEAWKHPKNKCTLPSGLFPDPYGQRGAWTKYAIDTRGYLLPVTRIDVLNVDDKKSNYGYVFRKPVEVYEDISGVRAPETDYIAKKIYVPDATYPQQGISPLICSNNIVGPSVSQEISADNLGFQLI